MNVRLYYCLPAQAFLSIYPPKLGISILLPPLKITTMAEAELSLINKVDLRIALADTDAKLTSQLDVFLPPLILKLASPHTAVRTKVIGICQHINTRIKSGYVCWIQS